MLKSTRKVIAVCATRTGAGKSPLTEYISLYLKRKGYKVGIVRHPMPYGDLEKQEVQKFSNLKDLDDYECTLEEREDYERHIRNGFTVYAGVDYEKVLRLVESENSIILWDGGNNDFPFFKPDLMFTVADAMRPNHELSYHPGETNFRMCDVIVVNKWENNPRGLDIIERNAKLVNKRAKIVRISMAYSIEGKLKRGARTLVIEDGPTVTHGEMPYGIGYIVASKNGCNIIDGRKYAVGLYREVYKKYGHIEKVVPAVGYSNDQVKDLIKTIERAHPDVILSATPTDLSRLLKINIPIVNVSYKLKRNVHIERILDRWLSTVKV